MSQGYFVSFVVPELYLIECERADFLGQANNDTSVVDSQQRISVRVDM